MYIKHIWRAAVSLTLHYSTDTYTHTHTQVWWTHLIKVTHSCLPLSLPLSLSRSYPLSLTLLGIRRGRTPAAVDGLAKQAIRMHSGTTGTACNASIITKAALRSTDCRRCLHSNPNLKWLVRFLIKNGGIFVAMNDNRPIEAIFQSHCQYKSCSTNWNWSLPLIPTEHTHLAFHCWVKKKKKENDNHGSIWGGGVGGGLTEQGGRHA